MLKLGCDLAEDRELGAKPLSRDELDALIGKRDHLPFLSTRNVVYRERGLAANPPSRAEALRLIAEFPNLLRRPILVAGDEVAIGWNETRWKELAR
ncbi:MAG: hypothetical protein EXR73_08540 [Myxococcales bacterium]|nr:hypothetical protein [Myxococcales bacterium]